MFFSFLSTLSCDYNFLTKAAHFGTEMTEWHNRSRSVDHDKNPPNLNPESHEFPVYTLKYDPLFKRIINIKIK